jgi:AraC family transcriptional regulator of adaptative response / DNA-3-methyladenine glycosylase II
VLDDVHMDLETERCALICESGDSRFDGWFVLGVTSTGIYCRPSCPARTPRRSNMRFFPSSAAAHGEGFRACKRCRPDASPGSPEWDLRSDTAARAMQLIDDGGVDRDGVSGLASRLGYSERHLNRLMVAEVGAGPIALARARRAQTARVLVETTDLPISQVAFAAGFSSIRQFNDLIREVYAATPTELRAERPKQTADVATGWIALRLARREPFDAHAVFSFLGVRAIPGVEHWDGSTYRRRLELPHGRAAVELSDGDGYVDARLWLDDVTDLGAAVHRVRAMLDLDADPESVDAVLARTPLGAEVRRSPGTRVPATPDPVEALFRAIVGQQVTVAAGRTALGRIADVVGGQCEHDRQAAPADTRVWRSFPTAEQIAAVDPTLLAMPRARAETVVRAAEGIASGVLDLAEGADRDQAVASLLDVKGIGPWTASYVRMRGLRDPDVMLMGDVVVHKALVTLGVAVDDTTTWSPWRSYAVVHLWNALARHKELS